MDEQKRWKDSGRLKGIVNLLALALTAAAYAPFVIAARYALFHGDDFSNVQGTFLEPAEGILSTAISKAWFVYTTWQGTWLCNFLCPLLNPLRSYSFAKCRVILMGGLCLMFAASLLLCNECDKSFRLGKNYGIFTALFLLPLLTVRNYSDPCLWFVGAMNYVVPAFFLGFGLTLLLRSVRIGSRGVQIGACLCLFLSGGCVLLFGGLGACLTLLLFLTAWLETGKADRRLAAGFLAVLLGDLINVLAPGNYVKAPGELPIFKTVGDALRTAAWDLGFQMSHLIFPAAVLLALLLGLRYGKRLKPVSLALAAAGLLLTPAVTAFPYLLGYNVATTEEIATRAWFVIDIALVFCFLTLAVLIGGQLRHVLGKGSRRALQTVSAVGAAVLLLLCLSNTGESVSAQVAENLRNGKVQAYAAEWHEIFDMLSQRPGEHVVIESQPDPCVGVYPVAVGASPQHPMNFNMARYFGNASIMDAWYAHTYGVPGPDDGAGENAG